MRKAKRCNRRDYNFVWSPLLIRMDHGIALCCGRSSGRMLQTEQRDGAAVGVAEGCCGRSSEGCCGRSSGRMLQIEQRRDAVVGTAEGCCRQNSGMELQ